MTQYPVTMHHPHFRKGNMRAVDSQANAVGFKGISDIRGEPDLFPPVVVHNDAQEGFHRSKGYLLPGEAPAPKAAYSEYPVMLHHPDHVDGVPDTFDIRKEPSGVVTFRVPGTPERFPPVTARNADEEEQWISKGYARAGKADADASAKSKANPYDPNYHHDEYPKMVDGLIVDPHNEIGFQRYPMWVGDALVQDEDEERAARAKNPNAGKPPPAERCIICGQEFKQGEAHATGAAGPYHLSHLGGAIETPTTKPGRRAKAKTRRKAKRVKRMKLKPEPQGTPDHMLTE